MPKLQSINLRNYKSFRELNFELKDLNILIGYNGAGKSNLLSFFKFLQAASDEHLANQFNAWGGMAEMRWKGADKTASIFLGMNFEETHITQEMLYYRIIIESQGNSFAITDELLDVPVAREYIYPHPFLEIAYEKLQYLNGKRNDVLSPNQYERLNPRELFLAQVRDPINYPILSEARNYLNSWMIFRGFGEDAIAHIYDSQSLDVISPLRLAPDGSNLISVLYAFANDPRYGDYQESLMNTLEFAFPDFKRLVFTLTASGRAELRWVTKQGWDFPARSMSDGMIRFLGLATLLSLPEPPALIAIDEPEIGLHPRLIPILASMLKTASKQSQIIVSTHSPQLLNGDSITAEDVVIVENEGSESTLRRLDADKLRLWLERYTLGQLWTLGRLEHQP